MKLKVIEKSKVVPEFEAGDYFLTASGNVRQIISNIKDGYSALDVKDGRHYYSMDTIDSLIREYHYQESPVKKIEIAGFDRKTKEVLFMEV